MPINIHGAAFPFVSLGILDQKCPKLKTSRIFFLPFFWTVLSALDQDKNSDIPKYHKSSLKVQALASLPWCS